MVDHARSGEAADNPFPHWMLKVAAFAAALLVLAAGAALLTARPVESPVAYRGNVLNSPIQTPPFRLTDETGTIVEWADYRGKLVVLTFLYTSCTDVCPLTTAKLRKSQDLLGADAARVSFVAITVDPERDTMEQARSYSERMGMLGQWDFLIGPREELDPLWKAYWASPLKVKLAAEANTSSETHQHDQEELTHGAPVHLIDAQGWGRVVFSETFQPEDLTADIQTLLRKH